MNKTSAPMGGYIIPGHQLIAILEINIFERIKGKPTLVGNKRCSVNNQKSFQHTNNGAFHRSIDGPFISRRLRTPIPCMVKTGEANALV
jgi:hypothetical protein